MCIPQIDIVPTAHPPRRRHQHDTRVPLSAECSSPHRPTSYVSISPRIIYRAPPPSPKRSSVPPSHRARAPRCESVVEVEVEVLRGKEALERELVVEEEVVKREERGAGDVATEVVAPPPAPAPKSIVPGVGTPPPLPPPPPSSPRLPRRPPSGHRHQSRSSSFSSSSSSDSSVSRYSLHALRARVDRLWDRVSGLEQWRDGEVRRRGRERERSWERRRPWGRGGGGYMGMGEGGVRGTRRR